MINRVDGFLMEKMLQNGLANIRVAEETINSLNVFPVADGDTGKNMRLTLENGLKKARGVAQIGVYLKALSEGMMLGARGNSGVILSQIFRGIAGRLAKCQAANVADLRNAFIMGYKTAYQSVVCPVEGTVLTVAREGIEHIRGSLDRSTSVEAFFAMYIGEMKKTLANTPDMLDVLKEYGVVDSGAVGYITIIEGMYKYLGGQILEDKPVEESVQSEEISFDTFHEDSEFTEGYCMEFILQLMRGREYKQGFDLAGFTKHLQTLGNSIVTTMDRGRVKVHIHTHKPSPIMTYAQQFGEFLTFKLDNMQVQHNEFVAKLPKKKPHVEFATVAVVNGLGMEKVFGELGCTVAINSGTMNTSTQEFLDAFEEANADIIVVLPNNKNIIRAAEQAAGMYEKAKIHVLHTISIVEGYYALSMDIPDETPERRLKAMLGGSNNVATLSETIASRDYEHNGIGCRDGQEIVLLNDTLVYAGEDRIQTVLAGIKRIDAVDEKEVCVLFRGDGISMEEQEELEEALQQEYPLLECTFLDGGQKIFNWLLGII